MKIDTQHMGVQDIAPEEVVHIWKGNLLYSPPYTHTVDVRIPDPDTGHETFGITESTALAIAKATGLAILSFESDLGPFTEKEVEQNTDAQPHQRDLTTTDKIEPGQRSLTGWLLEG